MMDFIHYLKFVIKIDSEYIYKEKQAATHICYNNQL